MILIPKPKFHEHVVTALNGAKGRHKSGTAQRRAINTALRQRKLNQHTRQILQGEIAVQQAEIRWAEAELAVIQKSGVDTARRNWNKQHGKAVGVNIKTFDEHLDSVQSTHNSARSKLTALRAALK